MTTDPFTEAANAAAREYVRTPRMNVGTVSDRVAEAHADGWEASRTHLAVQEPTDAESIARKKLGDDAVDRLAAHFGIAQEPTDAEVLAALNAQGVVVSPKMRPAPSLDYWGDKPAEAMRAALSAARAARRDEEQR